MGVKSAVTIDGGRLAIADLETPELRPGQVRVAVSYCGMCGSDLHWRTHFPLGTVMGHEVAGRIAEIGPGVTDWAIGDRVVVFPVEPCGECSSCLAGWTNICSNSRYGVGGPRGRGGYAESLVVVASMLLRLPDSLDDNVAVLVEPLTVGLHGVARSGADPTQPALVIGAGTIGIVTALTLRARGFERIVVVEPNAARRHNLARVGITAIDTRNVDEAARSVFGEAPAVIFECAGYPQAVADAVRLIAPRGKIVLLSAPSEAVALPQWELMAKEAEILSAIFYTRAEFAEAIALLDLGAVPSDALPVSVFSLDQAPRALDELVKRDTPHIKALLKP